MPTPDQDRIRVLEERCALLESRMAQIEQKFPPHVLYPANYTPPKLRPRPETQAPGWVPVFHKSPDCRGDHVAFYLIRPFSRTEKGDLDCMRTGPDLHKPTPGEASICTSCDAAFEMTNPADLDWTYALTDEHGQPPPKVPHSPPPTQEDPTGRLEAVMDAIGRAKSAGLI